MFLGKQLVPATGRPHEWGASVAARRVRALTGDLPVKAKKGLGRGLSGLIHRTDEMPPSRTEPPPNHEPPAGQVIEALPVGEVRPNPYQPRKQFQPDELQDLVASIREVGILQPVVVRRGPLGFELIAGERRLRAAKEAGLERIPALVRAASDEEMQLLALVENLQRVDLNAIEKARAITSLMRNLDLTQEAVATRVGKARTTIANIVRLLDLPTEVQTLVEEGRLAGAHARAVLAAKGRDVRVRLARAAAEAGWSVREIERRAKAVGETRPARRAPKPTEDIYLQDVGERLQRALGTRVRIRGKGAGGIIEIHYADAGELDRVLDAVED